MNDSNKVSVWLVFLLMALFAGEAFSQSTSGSISGNVKDANGAALPGATVTATNPTTSATQTATTNDDGVFVFPQLPPATYNIAVERDGFKRAEKTGVVLNAIDRLNSGDFVLEVGAVTETVTVQADVGQLQIKSESGERSELVSSNQLRNLALNGRTTLELVKILPGISSNLSGQISTPAQQLNQFSINGTRFTQKELTIDGASNVDTGNLGALHVTVNPDAIAEVKVLTSNFQAEYGKAGGGFIAFVTKSGTKDFRGTGRYFRRHDSLNANRFFNNALGLPRSLYRYDYFGYDIGGPVIIPGTNFNRNRDRVFFYFNQEYYEQLVPNVPRNIRVPTEAERAGDFSQTTDGNGRLVVIRDPLTGQPFPGNRIPRERFFRNGQAILNIYPQPNVVGISQFNFTSQLSSESPRREDIIRIDAHITDRMRLTGRFINNEGTQRRPYGGTFRSGENFPLTRIVQSQPGQNAAFTLVNTLSPTMTNEFIFGYSKGVITLDAEDDRATRRANNITFPLLFPDVNIGDFIPNFTYGGIPNQTFPTTSFSLPFDNSNPTYNFIDNLTKVAGQHTVKGGIYIQRGRKEQFPGVPLSSNISFNNDANNPLNTGHPYANALLGIYTTYTQANNYPDYTFIYHNVEGYIQDTWRVRPRLTFDYGLRLAYYQPQYNVQGAGGAFNPDLFDPTKAVRLYQPVRVGNQRRAVDPLNRPATLTVTNTLPTNFIGLIVPNSGDITNGIGRAENGYPKGGYDSRGIQFGPRLGFAYDLTGDGNTVVRGGFGVAYDRLGGNVAFDAADNPPTILTPRLFNGRLDELTTSGVLLAPTNIFGYAKDGKIPTIYSYSLGVQRNLGFKTSIDIAYVGTASRHLSQTRDLNAIPYFTTFQRQAQDPSRFADGIVPEVEQNLPTAYRQAGFNFSGANALPADSLRPYPGHGSITYYEFVGSSNYHSLQASLNRRFAQGLTFGIAYTFSKVFNTADTETEGSHPFNTRVYDYKVADFDRTHIFVLNYVYDVPKLSRFISDNSLVRAVFDNYQVSGISQLSSGTPYELGFGIQGINAGQRITGSYTVGPGYRFRSDPQRNANGLAIDPNAFVIPGIGDIGPYSRGYLREPSFFNHDISIFKNFPFGGEGRRYLQLRLELFNVFNQTQFTSINGATQITASGGLTGAGIFNDFNNLTITNNLRPGGSTAPTGQFFGEYNNTRDPRIIQLGVKLYF